jgi:hypothetical protein
MAPRSKPETVSARPLFDWFKADKGNRAKLRSVGYTDGRITNWKARGLPRAEVGGVALIMGITFEQYLVRAGEIAPNAAHQPAAIYRGLSEEALQIARAFDRMTPQTKDRVREHVFLQAVIDVSFPWLRSGKPVSANYEEFEQWHRDNAQAQLTLEAGRLSASSPGIKTKK